MAVSVKTASFDVALPFDVPTIRNSLFKGKLSGVILYRGPSMLDGAPIVMVATSFAGSDNEKTGDLVQTYIVRDDMHPKDAVNNGADASVCGACIHRKQPDGSRSCYVNLAFGVGSVARGLAKGIYPDMSGASDDEIAALGAGLRVRLGTYGDPAAVPFARCAALIRNAEMHTAYTHQWRAFPAFAAIAMASADSEDEAREAWSLGWRTFRVAPAIGWNALPGEILCPASAEAGKRTTCERCSLCGGAGVKAKSIMIPNHSASANAAKRRADIFRKAA